MRNRRDARPGLSLVLAFGLAAALAGCTPWATYPPVEGSVDMSNPELTPIPELMSMAITNTHERDGRDEEIIFNLPPGTPPVVYERVAFLMGGGRPMESAGETAITVLEVRVRAVESEVDVIHLNAEGRPEEMTIAFKQNLLRGFRVASIRPWRYRVDMPPPHLEQPDVRTAGSDEAVWDDGQAVGADAADESLADNP